MKKRLSAIICVFSLSLITAGCPVKTVTPVKDETSQDQRIEETAGQVRTGTAQPGTCVTAKCHTGIDREAFTHKPVAAGQCSVCHGNAPGHSEAPSDFHFPLIENIPAKCFACHNKFPDRKFTHTPVAYGQCTACHDPHGSPNKFQLPGKGGELCFICHDRAITAGEFIHGPTAVGACVACHEPHTAEYANNLRNSGPALCYTCHVDKADAIRNAEYVHSPVSKDCAKCHNPHSETKQYMLAAGAPLLCYDCHEDKGIEISNAAVKHGAVSEERSCLNCHDAHASNIAKTLVMPPMDLCLSCHDRQYKVEDIYSAQTGIVNDTIKNMKELFRENKNHHGPIRQKDCSGCHNPHGSGNFRILRHYYPPTFYEPFSAENYALCFSCHEKAIVLNPKTTRLTNFRNGDDNLHFRHVNKPDKGRTCRACHQTHASNYPKHVRASVPFGVWELPVNYQKTETGGQCLPGCHALKAYDREKKVLNK